MDWLLDRTLEYCASSVTGKILWTTYLKYFSKYVYFKILPITHCASYYRVVWHKQTMQIYTDTDAGASTPHKRWSKCTTEKVGEVFAGT